MVVSLVLHLHLRLHIMNISQNKVEHTIRAVVLVSMGLALSESFGLL